jgi:hypothetical protein
MPLVKPSVTRIRYVPGLTLNDGYPGYADMDADPVYLYEKGANDWIGTDSLATCVAVIATGKNPAGQWRAGICHVSGAVDDVPTRFNEMVRHMMMASVNDSWRGWVIGGSQAADHRDLSGNDENLIAARVLKSRLHIPFTVIENYRVFDDEDLVQFDDSAATVRVTVEGNVLVISYDGLTLPPMV